MEIGSQAVAEHSSVAEGEKKKKKQEKPDTEQIVWDFIQVWHNRFFLPRESEANFVLFINLYELQIATVLINTIMQSAFVSQL